jgi:metal-sulfur cluster biosynthetic enzyme
MTLTSMGCPLAGVIVDQVNAALSDIPEVKETDVNIVWNPPWTKDRMSRYAKIALGIR